MTARGAHQAPGPQTTTKRAAPGRARGDGGAPMPQAMRESE